MSAGLVTLVQRRMLRGAILFALYALWVVFAHAPSGLSPGLRLSSGLWTVAIFTAGGAVLGALIVALPAALASLLPVRFRPHGLVGLETAILLPILSWLILNEIVYSQTAEVIGRETLAMIWSNPGATFEAAWEMGGRYLVLAGVLVVVAAGALYVAGIRSARRLARPAGSSRIRRTLTGSLTGGLILVTLLLTWQISTKPSAALTTVLRSAPPLKALSLTRVVARAEFVSTTPVPVSAAAPLVSDAEYQASLGAPRRPAPNVVLIVLESVSAKSLHCYGYPRPDVTPNMDALAAGGILFEHCWGTASFSSYGLVSIMTSLHMLRAEHNDHFTDTSFPHVSLPRALKLAGYETALFSSGNESFDHISDFYPPSEFDRYYSHDTSGIRDQKDCMRMDDRHAFGEFERWMAGRDASRPFYCSFYLQSTHFNYEVPEPWASHYTPVPPLFSNGDAIIRIPPDVLPLLRNQYDNAMRYADHWIGRIRDTIASAGGLDNTIIVITSDHGEAFMEHGLARHGVHLWEEMIHIPFILYVGSHLRDGAGMAAGQQGSRPLIAGTRIRETVSAVDIAPTVAGVVGTRPHPAWQGVDVLAEGYTSLDRPIFSVLQLTRWQEAICLNGWKYIYDLTDVQPYLFDLNTDPGERQNLVEAETELATALRDILAGWNQHQIAYYAPANRPHTTYIPPFAPSQAQLEQVRTALQPKPPI